MERSAVTDPRGVTDDLLALDLVREDHRPAVAGKRAEEDGLARAPHQLAQRGPGDLGQAAVRRGAEPQLERAAAQAVLAEAPLLEIAARGERAEQREQAALGRLELGRQLAEGQPVEAGHHQLEDVHHAAGRPVRPGGSRLTPGGSRPRPAEPLRDRGRTHRGSAGTSKPKKRAALSPSTLARAGSERWPMVRSIASAEWGQVPS